MSSRVESLILRRLAAVKNGTVGEAIGKDESTISRIGHNERGLLLCELEAFFDVLGLKVIESDGEVVSLPKEELDALRVLARKSLSKD